MNSFLKVYNGTLNICGPVFIGDGSEVNKKEYIYNQKDKKVLIPELSKMYGYFKKKNISNSYEQYMLTDNKNTLSQWVKQQGLQEREISPWIKYSLDCGDAIWERGKQMEIRSFIKDSYGCPYIPGSSVKGMLRTILLAYHIEQNQSDYSSIKRDINMVVGQRAKRNIYLKRETKKVEEIAFNKAGRTDRISDMVNDIMSGVIVSDSVPLSVNDLTLCQKVEYHTDGTEKRLNLLRECLKPGTNVEFKISIDESVCNYTIDYINKAIAYFNEKYYEIFSGKFSKVTQPAANTVWLGGGTGFVSKTIIYNMFGKQGLKMVPQIFQNINVPREHGHNKDEYLGVSPHILKKTKCDGRDYQFGECALSFTEIV